MLLTIWIRGIKLFVLPLITHRERLILVEKLPEFFGTKARIRLQGRWLAAAGFLPRTRVRVSVMTGCLVITREDCPPISFDML
ncbi:type I toxin-antitoxin system SymE family toxin [Glaciimonas immobilis]|nr:type I toxin-antitoxin system SymE family toxin [Glaciimonas immobilis]